RIETGSRAIARCAHRGGKTDRLPTLAAALHARATAGAMRSERARARGHEDLGQARTCGQRNVVTRAAQRSIERGGIWIVPLDPTPGHAQQGTRPVLVLSSSDFNSHFGKCYIAPITQGGNAARYGGYAVSWMGTGLHTQGVVLLTDVRALD